jgi:outer membrane usher protein FimD/PapC
MANIPISQLTGITSSTATTLIPVVESGTTYKIERDELIPRAYAQYILTTDQTLVSSTATTVNLDASSGGTNVSLSANTITFTSGGTFLISVSYQFSQGSGSADVAFWFKKNASEISNSATHKTIPSNTKSTSMVSIIQSFSAGDTLQLRIQSTSNNTTIDNITASGSIPDAPGVILDINQIY